jgi:hypothetical protein
VPPLNRPHDVVQVLAGVVDTDTYLSPVNIPFVAIAPDGVHTLAKGTPLVQIIPIHRAGAAIEGSVRVETKQEGGTRQRIHRNTLASSGWYRRDARAIRR